MNELALFAGAGGGILGGLLCGFRTVCAVENDAYARDVLVARQNDRCLEAFPIWDDVQTFDGTPWRGSVDVVSGGFPCQDISAAGKGAGIEGERSSMWKHMARIIGEVLPPFVFVENSPMLVGRGLGMVLGDLAEMGYDAEWGIVGARHAGAPHKRDRIWIVAYAPQLFSNGGDDNAEVGPRAQQVSESGDGGRETAVADAVCDGARKESANLRCPAGPSQIGARRGQGPEPRNSGKDVAEAESIGSGTGLCKDGAELHGNQPANCGGDVSDAGGERGQLSAERELSAIEQPWSDSEARSSSGITGKWWATEPDVGRVAHGVAARVDRLRCIGNGQVPRVVPLAWEILST